MDQCLLCAQGLQEKEKDALDKLTRHLDPDFLAPRKKNGSDGCHQTARCSQKRCRWKGENTQVWDWLVGWLVLWLVWLVSDWELNGFDALQEVWFVTNHKPTQLGAYTMSLCDFVQALHLCRVQLAALDFIAPIKGKQTKVSQYLPIGSMYGIFTYIWLILMVNVCEYTIHGSYGLLIAF